LPLAFPNPVPLPVACCRLFFEYQVQDGKKVGYRVGDNVVYFDDLPASWETSDTMVVEAIKFGYEMGAQSPNAQGLVAYLNTTQRKQIEGLTAEMAATKDGLADTLAEAVADSAKCTASGRGVDADGNCVGVSWVVATDAEAECTVANSGALRHAPDAGGLQICSDAAWSPVAPPDLGR
jgi:hypothetical protein